MSEDRRELILKRLLAIADGIEGIDAATRNDPALQDIDLPCITLFDGDEETAAATGDDNRPGHMPTMVHMAPQLSIVLQDNVADSGASLSAFRTKLVNAVLFDEQLAALAGKGGRRGHGNVRYAGSSQSVVEGRLIVGRLNTHFRISYVLDPANLV